MAATENTPNWYDDDARPASSDPGTNARAAIVNRTHRVVRERAQQMQQQRSNARSLALPLTICSVLLLMLSYAAWTVFSGTAAGFGSELEEEAGKLLSGSALDTGGPGFVLFLWFLPVSAVTLGSVMFRRTRDHRHNEVSR